MLSFCCDFRPQIGTEAVWVLMQGELLKKLWEFFPVTQERFSLERDGESGRAVLSLNHNQRPVLRLVLTISHNQVSLHISVGSPWSHLSSVTEDTLRELIKREIEQRLGPIELLPPFGPACQVLPT